MGIKKVLIDIAGVNYFVIYERLEDEYHPGVLAVYRVDEKMPELKSKKYVGQFYYSGGIVRVFNKDYNDIRVGDVAVRGRFIKISNLEI